MSLKFSFIAEKSPLSVPYEISQWEDQFLQEAAKLMGKNHSSLDTCNHRIILKLKDTCRELSSEELGKLAVLLLNCQLQTEERQLYTCTSEMVNNNHICSLCFKYFSLES